MKNTILKAVKVGSAAAATFALSAQLLAVQAANVDVSVRPGQGYAVDLGSIINFGLQVVMVIALLLVFGFLIMGGVEWITSGGEKSKTESARNKITSAVIGLIVLAASYAILQLMLHFLGFSDLTGAINGVNPINQGGCADGQHMVAAGDAGLGGGFQPAHCVGN